MNAGKVKLLDCTLRDGGYVNDWQFGKNNIATIFERLVSAGVDVIEVGFLDERRSFDPERTIMPDTDCIEKIFGKMNRGKAMLVGMIDYGTCSLTHLKPASESMLDGIRIIFKKENRVPAMQFAAEVKKLGYQVFCQLVSITGYSDAELEDVIALANKVHPYALSMVDTYGLCDENTVSRIVRFIDSKLAPDICLGYHAHNNFQLGYSNTIAVLNAGLKREVLADGTLYGMGKSAGNAPLELLAMYMNLNFGRAFQLGQIQEAISTCILDLYRKKPWGYTLFYFIAASNRCHPDYVSWLMNKRTLSVSAVGEILQQIPEKDRLGKNMKLIENLYLEYQKKECNDEEALKELGKELRGKKILLVGPGRQAMEAGEDVLAYIRKVQPCVISINYVPENIPVTHLFMTNARRHLQMSSDLIGARSKGIRLIATSNLTAAEESFDYLVNFCSLIDETEEFPDNSMKMLIRLLEKLGCRDIALAGFDGYTAENVNYFDAEKEYSFVKQKAESLNESAKAFFRSLPKDITIRFITKSRYQE